MILLDLLDLLQAQLPFSNSSQRRSRERGGKSKQGRSKIIVSITTIGRMMGVEPIRREGTGDGSEENQSEEGILLYFTFEWFYRSLCTFF